MQTQTETATANPPEPSGSGKTSRPAPADTSEAGLLRLTLHKLGVDTAGIPDAGLPAALEAARARQAGPVALSRGSLEESVRQGMRDQLLREFGVRADLGATGADLVNRIRAERRKKLGSRWFDDGTARRDPAQLLRAAKCPPLHAAHLAECEGCRPWARMRDLLIGYVTRPGGCIVAVVGIRGTGKTQAAVSAIGAACDRGLRCRFATFAEMFTELRPFDDGEKETERQAYLRFAGYDVLVVDELHQRGETVAEQNALNRVLNARYGAMKATVLIGNFGLEDFGQSVGDSVISRIDETGEILSPDWPSFRKPGMGRLS